MRCAAAREEPRRTTYLGRRLSPGRFLGASSFNLLIQSRAAHVGLSLAQQQACTLTTSTANAPATATGIRLPWVKRQPSASFIEWPSLFQELQTSFTVITAEKVTLHIHPVSCEPGTKWIQRHLTQSLPVCCVHKTSTCLCQLPTSKTRVCQSNNLFCLPNSTFFCLPTSNLFCLPHRSIVRDLLRLSEHSTNFKRRISHRITLQAHRAVAVGDKHPTHHD